MRWIPSVYYIYWTPCMEFYLIQNQSHLLHMIIQKTYSSIIAALFCVSLMWWTLTLKQQNVLLTMTSMWMCIYTYTYTCFVCIYVYMYVCYFYFISFISSMSETNIRPCIALWQIALYRNLALLLVWLHHVLTTIHLEIEIRAYKPRLSALIAVKDCYPFFFLIYWTLYLPSASANCVTVTCVLFCILYENYITSWQ